MKTNRLYLGVWKEGEGMTLEVINIGERVFFYFLEGAKLMFMINIFLILTIL